MSFSLQLRTAVEVPRQSLAFYRRQLPLIAGISLLPGLERFVAALTDPPGAVATLLELLTAGARVLLLYVIVRLAFAGPREAGRPGRFLLERWPSLVVQWALLAAVVVVFSVIPDQVVAERVPDDFGRIYNGLVLLIKNVTVIAFTFIWLVLGVRQILTYPGALNRPGLGDPAGSGGGLSRR